MFAGFPSLIIILLTVAYQPTELWPRHQRHRRPPVTKWWVGKNHAEQLQKEGAEFFTDSLGVTRGSQRELSLKLQSLEAEAREVRG